MNILAVGCHPDDIEVGCAGTLIKYKKAGHKVTVCHVANGNLGHGRIEPEELRVIRAKEAKSIEELTGIEVLTCDIGDLLVYNGDKRQRDLVIDVIRKVQPDVIITHSPQDYMPDHNAVSKLVFDASFAASVPHYKTAVPDTAGLTPIYYMDTVQGIHFLPTDYVDISDTIEMKLQMLNCHISQMEWMREHDNVDFAETVRICGRFRGLQCGANYAEGFAKCYAWPKLVPHRLLP